MKFYDTQLEFKFKVKADGFIGDLRRQEMKDDPSYYSKK